MTAGHDHGVRLNDCRRKGGCAPPVQDAMLGRHVRFRKQGYAAIGLRSTSREGHVLAYRLK
jgi:hypothetical protein